MTFKVVVVTSYLMGPLFLIAFLEKRTVQSCGKNILIRVKLNVKFINKGISMK